MKDPRPETLATSQESKLAGLVLLIPAYNPDQALRTLVERLTRAGFPRIVIVNDGSAAACQPLFAVLSRLEEVQVVNHETNLGKGAALKTGMRYILDEMPDTAGIVTADADGQHLPQDILQVAERLLEHPSALILGSRGFGGSRGFSGGENGSVVPWRSRVGNTFTRKAVKLLVGAELHDTQTGLRGIPASFAPQLLPLTPTGYDFELDMLIAARKDTIEIIEQPIRTVYEPGNQSSHFNPLVDSIKIGFVLLRFSSASLLSALLDNTLFYLIYHNGHNILAAQAIARATAALFNYFLVRRTVFNVRGRDSASFPKYLTLVALTGSVSYACIRLITGTTGIPVFRTKIAVETLLFFLNFTMQRDWVFLRPKKEASQPRKFRRTDLLWLLLVIPAVIEGVGFREAGLLDALIWTTIGGLRFAWYFEFFLAATLFFGIFARRFFLPALVAAVVACSVVAVGFAPVGAVLLFVFSCTVLGRLWFGEAVEGPLAFVAGAAAWVVLMYVTLALPVHYRITHLAALALPVFLGYRQAARLSRQWLSVFRPARVLPRSPEFFASAGLAFVLIANWLIVLKPEISTDGLAMHLAIATNIARHHAFTIDFHQFIWALMPIGADLLYSFVYTIAGEYAARLLNFAVLAGIAALLVRSTRAFVSRPVAIFLAMLFVSTPLAYLVTGSLFVENFVAIMVLGAAAALWRFHETGFTRYLLLTALLFGVSMDLKVGAVATALLAAALLLYKMRRPVAGLAVAALLAVGSIPYAGAWWKSGNPFFPFQTGPFKSSLVGNDIRDHQFNTAISFNTPYDLTFHTNSYFEGQGGSFGFQYLLFLPLILVTAAAVKSFKARSVIFLGVGTALIIAATQPNARYFYFILPVLTVGIAASLAWLRENDAQIFRAALVLAGAACFLNIWFLPVADWYHRDFFSSPLFSAAGRSDYVHHNSPEREAISFVNRARPGVHVLLADDSDIATVSGPVDSASWHDYSFAKSINSSHQPVEIYRFLMKHGIGELVVDDRDGLRDPGLTTMISTCGQTEFRSGSFTAIRLRTDCERTLIDNSNHGACVPGQPLPRGVWDDSDSRISLLGAWTREMKFPATWNKTISYSDHQDNIACMTIAGPAFRYIYTKALNRGLAEIRVDGEKKTVIDLYSHDAKWQQATTISGLGPGEHQIAIRVVEQKNNASSGYYVDLDSIEVF